VLVLSDNVVAPLVSAAVQNGDLTAIRKLGKLMGEHVRAELDGAAGGLAADGVLGHIGGILALFGWGRLTFERWGDALVAVVDSVPTLDEEHLGVAALLGGVFSVLAGREIACVPMEERRFLLVDPSIAEQVWMWSKEGASLGEIVGNLIAGGGE
jgi:hypothetical protein